MTMTATATTVPEGLGARSWNSLIRMAAIVAVLVVLAVGSFAFGRTSADSDDGTPAVAPISTNAPQVDANSCGHIAHTPPC
jgi:hypothetical protein